MKIKDVTKEELGGRVFITARLVGKELLGRWEGHHC